MCPLELDRDNLNCKEVTTMNQIHAYKIDLTKIDGNGDFFCPKCGSKISPDDETEEVYCILNIYVNKYGLEEVEILCNNCSSHIHLTGFSLLEKISEMTEKVEEGKEEAPWYIPHM
jgi:DNA-directed RNA polymerase subunit RPC12/RpoP